MAKSKEMEIAIKIAGKVESSFKSALGTAVKGLGSITKAVGAATAAAAGAVAAMGKSAVDVGMEFENAMSQVSATMLIDKTTEEGQKAFETLENAARECGRSTAFSATEAAEALNYLALAGYDAEKAATALPTVLKLAGAGAMDLASASDMVTDSMSALGIEATEENLTRFSDQLAQTASKANTSVAQLGEAILTVGGTAKGLAGGTTELNTALGILADNGLKGAEGGTHLRNIILSLQNPTDKAAEALQSLGIGVYDSEGKMRGLNEVFKDLQGAMDGMSNAQKDNILSTLFNKTDLTAANAMLSSCADRFDELSEAVENSAGACEKMYAIQLDNLQGDIDILKSGLSDLGISVYKDLNGPLREMTQLATSMVEELSSAYQNGGMEGMVGAVGGCLAKAVDVIADYAPELVNMGVSLTGSFIQGIADNSGSMADVASQVLTVFIRGIFTTVPQVVLAGIDIITQLADSITGQLPALISSGTQAVVGFVSGIVQRLPAVISTALTLVQTLVSSIGANAPMLIGAAIQLIGNLVTGLLSMLPYILQMGIQLIISLIQGIIANLGNIVQAAIQIVFALISGLLSAIPQIIAAVPQLIEAIIDTIFTTNWLDVGIQIIKGIIDGILATGKSLWSAIKSLVVGGDIELPDTSGQGEAVVKGYASGISNNTGVVSSAVNGMAAGAFGSMDSTGASDAGEAAAKAFSTGLNNGMMAGGFDTAAFNANMASIGTMGTDALGTAMGGNIPAVTQAATNLGTDVNTALDDGWEKANSSAQTEMQRLVETVTAAAKTAAQAVKSAFESMSITIPKPKIPVIDVSMNSVTYGNGGNVSVPQFSVNWNALGGIFDSPTVLNTAGNGLQGVGEAGPEAVLPLDTLWVRMKEIVSQAVRENSGTSMIDALVEKLRSIGGGGTGQPRTELAGTGGMTIQWAPVYNLYGNAGKEEVAEADGMSQAEFEKRMRQWEKDNRRKKL